MRLHASVLALGAILLWSCSSGADTADPSDDEYTLPEESLSSKSFAPADRTVTGRLTFDDIEGGCTFLETADGTRYEVLYPAGWVVDRATGELRGPAGELAQAGDEVSVRGRIASDRSSICQVGPILEATEVALGT